MTITRIKKNGGKGSRQGLQTTYTVSYQVAFSGQYDEATLLNSGGTSIGGVTLPSINQAHSTDLYVVVSNIEADLEGNSSPYDGLATYQVTYTASSFDSLPIHPLDRDPQITWRGTSRTEVARVDINGKAILNSAKQLYDPLPEKPTEGGEVSISYNISGNPASICANYSNTVNSGAIWGVPAGNGLIGIIEGTRQSELFEGVTVNYWTLSLPIAFNNQGWRFKCIDNGYKYLNAGEPETHRDKIGTPTPTPILLNGSGGEYTGTDGVIFPTAGYKIINETSWSGISGLPNPFA